MTKPKLAALLAALPVFASAAARANDLHGYYDILIPEAVGELREKQYDLSQQVGDGDWRFVGNTRVKRGLYTGGGFGLHVLVAWPRLLLIGGEASVTGGRLNGAEMPWTATSTALHYSVLAQVGIQHCFEIVMLHASAVFGVDGMRFDVAGASDGVALLTGPGTDGPPSYRLSRYDLRAGVQVGIHVNVARFVALWVDGEIDYDGQYRVRGGLAIGAARNERF
jgi:hypothetical protein